MGEKKLQCVSVCVVFITPLSRSLSIWVLQSWGAFEWVSVCVYVAEFTEDRVKVCLQGYFRLIHSETGKESKRRLIIFLSISKCLGACGEGEELSVQERATSTKGKQLHSPFTTGMLRFFTSEVASMVRIEYKIDLF